MTNRGKKTRDRPLRQEISSRRYEELEEMEQERDDLRCEVARLKELVEEWRAYADNESRRPKDTK